MSQAGAGELERPRIKTADGLRSSMVYHTHRCDSFERAAETRPVTGDEMDRYRMRQCSDCRKEELAGLDLPA